MDRATRALFLPLFSIAKDNVQARESWSKNSERLEIEMGEREE